VRELVSWVAQQQGFTLRGSDAEKELAAYGLVR
jgi:hypothetical protein